MNTNVKFLQIDNDFFNQKEDITLFHQIGTEGFTIYCCLLFIQKNSAAFPITIKMIREFLNRDITKKQEVTEGLCDKRTILKYIIALERVELIESIGRPIDNTVKLNDVLILKVKKCTSKSWSGISENLFIDNVHKLGHIGWSIYCLLYRLHNENYGNQMAGNYGFACPAEKYIGDILDRHENTVKAYLPRLERYNLVEIIPQYAQPYVNKNGETEYKYMPNHYIVKAKVYSDNKYFINFMDRTKIER